VNIPFARSRLATRLKNTARDTHRQFDDAQLLMVAGNLAYTTILSLIPALAVSFAIFKAFGGLDRLYEIVQPFILTHLTEGAGDQAIVAMKQFLGNVHTTAIGIGGFAGLVLTTMTMLMSFESAINRAWQVKVTRPLFRRIAYYWIFITLGPVALSVVVGAATSSDVPLYSLLPSWIGLFAIGVGLFFLVFKVVPNTKVHTPYALIASLTTSVLLEIARRGYALYTTHFVSYNKVYGSLGAVPILLVWIYILWLIILFGAALTAAMQKKLQLHEPEPAATNGGKPDARA
jgi:membrane protein